MTECLRHSIKLLEPYIGLGRDEERLMALLHPDEVEMVLERTETFEQSTNGLCAN
jgi:hypothetical protein